MSTESKFAAYLTTYLLCRCDIAEKLNGIQAIITSQNQRCELGYV